MTLKERQTKRRSRNSSRSQRQAREVSPFDLYNPAIARRRALNPKTNRANDEQPGPVMSSCMSSLESQIVTYLSVPHEILLLRHKVFREYAKLAVGPDFIHTLPSFLILTALIIVLWRNPPSSTWLARLLGTSRAYRFLQVFALWICVNAALWSWLNIQRLLYCSVWTYWSYESEYREMTYPWWQRIWGTYYPPPIDPPVLSAGFISWIICMLVAITTLSCAISTSQVHEIIDISFCRIQEKLGALKACVQRIRNLLFAEKASIALDESELSSVCDDCRSELSADMKSHSSRREIHPISYGTNWTPKPNFYGYNDPPKKSSMKSLHVIPAENNDGQEEDSDRISPRQLRHRRGCHTVIPSIYSDKSSGC